MYQGHQYILYKLKDFNMELITYWDHIGNFVYQVLFAVQSFIHWNVETKVKGSRCCRMSFSALFQSLTHSILYLHLFHLIKLINIVCYSESSQQELAFLIVCT